MRVQLIAHRGAMAKVPENTIAAFDAALEHGLSGFECDIQMTKDGVPVVFHDETLQRVTGESGSINDYTYDELSLFDYGRWFSEKFAGAGLPTLESILYRYANKATLMIELKTASQPVQTLVDKSLSLFERMVPDPDMENIYILCFDMDVLYRIKEAAPRLKCILNLSQPFIDGVDIAAPENVFYGYGLAFHQLTQLFVQEVHGAGKKIMTYSCNTPAQVDAALELGVDYVLTDDPARVADHFRKSDQHRFL